MGIMQEKLELMFRPAVEALGCELVGIEHISQGKHTVLRIYIDSENGVTLDDCEKVSHQISGILEVEDPIRGQYNLEVSSPGLDRPLFSAAHFARFIGSNVKLRTRQPIDGQRKFNARIEAVEGDMITLNDESRGEVQLHITDVEKANLVPEF